MDCHVEVEGVEKHYYGVGAVLAGVHLAASRGDSVLVVGPNGSGKTTLLRVIAGVEPPSRGRVAINGYSAGSLEAKRYVGLVLDKPGLYPELTVRENLEFYSRLRGGKPPTWALGLLGLTWVLDRRAGELSYGWRRRADLARALVGEPPLLLVDEPYAGQDPEGREAVSQIIDRLAARGCVIATSPDMAAARLYGWSRVVMLRDGRLEPV